MIASSILVVFPHYYGVSQIPHDKLNYTYEQYSFISPVYYGLMNMLSLYLALLLGLSSRERYLLIGTLSPLLVISFAYLFRAYTYSTQEWQRYAIGLFIKHFLIWNIVVFGIDAFV